MQAAEVMKIPACEKCGSPMIKRNGPKGDFWGCSTYPRCKYTKSILADDGTNDTNSFEKAQTISEMICELCGNPMVLREGHSKFWGCSAYPTCRNTKPYTKLPTPSEEETADSLLDNNNLDELENIVLGEEQQAVFQLLELSNENIWVSGKAGTGKSVLLKYFVTHTSKNVIVLAPTGIAAIRVSGQTLHSFFAFDYTALEPEKVWIDNDTAFILQNTDAFIIDEISMVRSDVMECVNRKFQIAKKNKLPFGGVQMIVFGDLYQLQPVVAENEIKRYLDDNFGGAFFFCAPVFRKMKFINYELEHIYRQKEKSFQDLLNEVRSGKISKKALSQINERCGLAIPINGILTLATTNAKVAEVNENRLRMLPGDEYIYEATLTGDIDQCIKPTNINLVLKVGAQVMMLRNDRQRPMRWANGTLGEVTGLTENEIKVKIDGNIYDIERVTWHTMQHKYDDRTGRITKETIATFTQFPLCLAWAITIHKSQGQTYKTVVVDFGRGAFTHGQAYVALSRCRSLGGLYLIEPLKESDIIVDKSVEDFIAKHKVPIPMQLQVETTAESTTHKKHTGTVVLISCSKRKRGYACMARHLYDESNLFSKSLAYAQTISEDIFVLSSKHGLVSLDTIIEPYEETLNNKSAEEQEVWGERVGKQLDKLFDVKNTEFVILAGKNYYMPLQVYLPKITLPLLNLQLGDRLAKLDSLMKTNPQNQPSMCFWLHNLFNNMPHYRWNTINKVGFDNGIYIVFEDYEEYHGMERIVRVGTHTSDGRLRDRLKDHFVNESKDGSIFRKNIGRAILSKNKDPYLNVWNVNTSKKGFIDSLGDRYNPEHQQQIETDISEYMRGRFTFVCFPVSTKNERERLEEGIIVSISQTPDFHASPDWLGNHSPEFEIVKSGMWLKQGLDGVPLTESELKKIKSYCIKTKNNDLVR